MVHLKMEDLPHTIDHESWMMFTFKKHALQAKGQLVHTEDTHVLKHMKPSIAALFPGQ